MTKVEVEGDQVRIDLAIPSDIKVPKDATAQIVPQSLIGERYIQLSPAFKDGMDTMSDGEEITDTIVPVEPDEALAALKEFLDSLDPDGIGDLVTNLEEDLRGNGAALNDTLGSLSQLVATFAENDDVLLRIIDSFDRLTATLVTREAQLGEVLDAFAEASQVLADERESIERLVGGPGRPLATGLRLVGEHSSALRTDIQTLADAAATIDANLSSVTQLLARRRPAHHRPDRRVQPRAAGDRTSATTSPRSWVTSSVWSSERSAPLPAPSCPCPPPLCDPVAAPARIRRRPASPPTSATPIGSLLTLLSEPDRRRGPRHRRRSTPSATSSTTPPPRSSGSGG